MGQFQQTANELGHASLPAPLCDRGKDFHTITVPHLKSCWWPCSESFSISISRQKLSLPVAIPWEQLRFFLFSCFPKEGSVGNNAWHSTLAWFPTAGCGEHWRLTGVVLGRQHCELNFIKKPKQNQETPKHNGSHNLKGRMILLQAYRWSSIADLGVMLMLHKTKTNPYSRQGSWCHCSGSCLFHMIFQSQSFGLCCHSWSLIKTWQRIQNKKDFKNILSLGHRGWRSTTNISQIGLYPLSAKCLYFLSRYFTFLFQLCLEYLQFPWVSKLGSQWYAAKQFPAKGCAITGKQAVPWLPTALSRALS